MTAELGRQPWLIHGLIGARRWESRRVLAAGKTRGFTLIGFYWGCTPYSGSYGLFPVFAAKIELGTGARHAAGAVKDAAVPAAH